MTAASIMSNYSSSQRRKFQTQDSSRFLTLDEKWGADEHNTSPTCPSEFPAIPYHPSMTPLHRRTSQELWNPCDLPSAPICGAGEEQFDVVEEDPATSLCVAQHYVDDDEEESDEYSVGLADEEVERAAIATHNHFMTGSHNDENNFHYDDDHHEEGNDYGYENTAEGNYYGYENTNHNMISQGIASETSISIDLYGYEDAAPSIASHQNNCCNVNNSYKACEYRQETQEEQPDYGYGEAAPDRAYKNDNEYGYEDAAPSRRRRSSTSSRRRSSTSSRRNSTSMTTELYESSTSTDVKTKRRNQRRASSSPDHATRRRTRRAGREKSRASAAANTTAPRRSSMKKPGQPRRATIQLGAERDVVLPITGERVKRRASITFDEIVVMQPVTSVLELTKNPEALWFQEEDVTNRREKSKSLVEAVESGLVAGLGMKPCLRGLEGFMGNHVLYKSALRYDGWDSVLEEQKLQIQKRTFDDQAVADVYQRASIIGHHMAAQRAQQDAKDVESYLQSTRRMCRRLSC